MPCAIAREGGTQHTPPDYNLRARVHARQVKRLSSATAFVRDAVQEMRWRLGEYDDELYSMARGRAEDTREEGARPRSRAGSEKGDKPKATASRIPKAVSPEAEARKQLEAELVFRAKLAGIEARLARIGNREPERRTNDHLYGAMPTTTTEEAEAIVDTLAADQEVTSGRGERTQTSIPAASAPKKKPWRSWFG